MPFIGPEAGNASRWRRIETVDLRQVDENGRGVPRFEVRTPFGHTTAPPAGKDGLGDHWPPAAVEQLVERGTETDLATVPPFLWGVIASYGRQTLPAIVHDVLCTHAKGPDLPVAFRRRARREADGVFLATLGLEGTGPVRRWIMWSGVRLGGHAPVLIPFGVLLASGAAAVVPSPERARQVARVASAVSALVFAGAVAGAGREGGLHGEAAIGSRPASGVEDFAPARVEARAVGSLLGAAAIGAVAAPILLPVAAVTWLTAALVGLGERRAIGEAGFGGEEAIGTRIPPRAALGGTTVRIAWAPLLRPGDSTINRNPEVDDF